ncbi:MAG: aromatic amino acid transport family protein [Chlamydiales bacterium]
MSFVVKKGSIFYATCLVTGTCIGVSFLSLPIVTGFTGFIPGILMSVIIWIFTLANAMFYAEATFGTPDGANFYTISKTFLGKIPAIIVSIIFLINMYAYIGAYILSGVSSFNLLSEKFLGFRFPFFLGSILYAFTFGVVVFCGIRVANRTNFIFLIGLVMAFLYTFYYQAAQVNTQYLTRIAWIYIYFSFPIIFSSFGFNLIIPTLCTYLHREKKKVQLSIFYGVTSALIFYIVWQWIIVGSMGKIPLWLSFSEGKEMTQFPWGKEFPMVMRSLNCVILFAANTSVIGVTLSMIDFYSDCFSIPLTRRIYQTRFMICCLIFLPSLPIILLYHSPFIGKIINYAIVPGGSFIINAIVPIFMVAKARYFYKLPTPHFVPGGCYLLFLIGFAIFFLIYLQGISISVI